MSEFLSGAHGAPYSASIRRVRRAHQRPFAEHVE